MDDEESVKLAKAKQLLELSDCITKCMEVDAKGHGLFLYSHDDVEHMTILTFNAQPDDVYGLVQSANVLINKLIQTAMKDAPPREKYN